MNWNFPAGNFTLRLPLVDQDGPALFSLLKEQTRVDHIPRLAMSVEAQALDELRRMAMRFETREAAFWLVEGLYDKQLLARIGIQKINWMLSSAQLQWELTDGADLPVLQEVLPAVLNFCFAELGLHRIEMRLRAGSESHETLLQQLGFHYEGCLPAQIEYNDTSVGLALYSRLSTD
ncbi:MAG: GNAT family N-acetyltransferase [Saccharospirillaceae bacterium]|nr:GNAT family N-acetyltransferase [Saccharospirillaceae bacterium]MCD8532875.1 GNAT family N-acetyltransferase [Saccharospirillaceae bacterium]